MAGLGTEYRGLEEASPVPRAACLAQPHSRETMGTTEGSTFPGAVRKLALYPYPIPVPHSAPAAPVPLIPLVVPWALYALRLTRYLPLQEPACWGLPAGCGYFPLQECRHPLSGCCPTAHPLSCSQGKLGSGEV